ncbi:MAG: phosphoribosyl-ATP diphosphatase [Caldilinea sp.]|nr:phosphoribosyl-ATP diphosphatase [Caldilineaceae bacterium]MCO5213324.1 phosphoribosyl-ATP diphosphatase [Caldilinea sp.]MCW5845082.1 phosphoribosyl-ATP diphosphatase [Caldilinea sp.]HRW51089.1 phosphoribosyl-ATP diphosphatase [Caldilinea sp.]
MSTIETLSATIQERRVNPRPGSYTATLFEKGENEVLKKMGEEAVEVIIAAKGETDDRVLYELADFVYHTLVFLNMRGLSWEDVEAELAQRFK